MSSFLHSFHKYLLHTYWVLDTVLGFYVIWTIMRVLYFDLFASTLTVTLKEPCLYIVVVFHSVLSDSLRPSALQHTRLPCPSPSPRICSNLCPLSRWCHPTISSSIIPISCPQSFPASGSFQMSQLFTTGGQILRFQLQHQSFQWTPRTDRLSDGLVGSPCCSRDIHTYSKKANC